MTEVHSKQVNVAERLAAKEPDDSAGSRRSVEGGESRSE